ncbi:MAG: DUF4347 domain-containing protein, partial [Thermostichus sp. BF3_bins_97]
MQEGRAEAIAISARQELVFVDPTLPDLAILLAGIEPSAEVILLDGDQDGIQQISDVLGTRQGIHAV